MFPNFRRISYEHDFEACSAIETCSIYFCGTPNNEEVNKTYGLNIEYLKDFIQSQGFIGSLFWQECSLYLCHISTI